MRKAARAELKLDTQYECYRKLIRKLYMLLNHVSKQVYLCTILNFKQAGVFILAFGCVFNHNSFVVQSRLYLENIHIFCTF